MTLRRFARLCLVASLLLQPLSLAAKSFYDVPQDYIYREAIEALADRGVIGGNPDGSFVPKNPVNRAAMLKMIYIASGKTPASSRGSCFLDVPAGTWFTPFVCDAADHGYVKGYGDGNFRPDTAVNRVEGIKMIMMVMGIPTDDLSYSDVRSLKFADTSPTEWYAKYLAAAFLKGILPVPGQENVANFGPTTLLSRGEAAAYIYNALTMKSPEEAQPSMEESSPSPAPSSSSSSSKPTEQAEGMTLDMPLPFNDKRQFTKKLSNSYRFTLDKATFADIEAGIDGAYEGGITCRLYHLENDGYATEYYLGFQLDNECMIRAALTPGNYQIDLQPTRPDVVYTIDAKIGSGDGNDGFSQASNLPSSGIRTDYLDSNDLEDWYKFTIKGEQGDQVSRTLSILSGNLRIGCLIYPAKNVDIYGFKQPDCNEPAIFSPGDYFVSVRHAVPFAVRQTYTIQLK